MSSFGEEIRRERELRQITLREIAEATKISLRYLDALERNDFKHLPGGVFNKGFVRAYAQFIGVDPEAMVNAYLLEEQDQQARVQEKRGSLSRRASAGVGSPDGAPAGRRRRIVVSVVVLLIALVAILGVLMILLRPAADEEGGGAPAAPSREATDAARGSLSRSVGGGWT